MQNQAMQMNREQSVSKGSVNCTACLRLPLYCAVSNFAKIYVWRGQIMFLNLNYQDCIFLYRQSENY